MKATIFFVGINHRLRIYYQGCGTSKTEESKLLGGRQAVCLNPVPHCANDRTPLNVR